MAVCSQRAAKFALSAFRNFTAGNAIKSRIPSSSTPGPTIGTIVFNPHRPYSTVPNPILQRLASNTYRKSHGSNFFPNNCGGFLSKNSCSNGFLASQRRFYKVDINQIRQSQSFRSRWYDYRRWWSYRSPRTQFVIWLIGSGVVGTICCATIETVPYSERTHIVMRSSLERSWGENMFNERKKNDLKGKILPANHKQSARVRSISNRMIEALKRRDEILGQDKKYKKNKKKSHFDELKWEVLVVDKPGVVNAFCAPGGKIVVYTGLLRVFKSDAEVATIIGHEIGHAVARHSAERVALAIWLEIMMQVLYQFVQIQWDEYLEKPKRYLLTLPCSRKDEKEADYIGLLLMASAGYDPRVAPGVYKKLGGGDSSLKSELSSTHPSGKTRAKLLSEGKVMQKAVSIYEEVRARHIN